MNPGINEASSSEDRRQRAYRAAAYMARERLRREAPEGERALRKVARSDVLVVSGCYDHVESVLHALEIEHSMLGPDDLDSLRLDPAQLLVVNCPGQVSRRAVGKITRFVAAGGSLFTTDWALKHVLEPAFPGVLEYNCRPTQDDVVRVEMHAHQSPFLEGVMERDDDPLWWLEASSYPIRILDTEKVEVLLSSRELGEKYGEEPVAVRFAWREGEVFHMISHYYLQRSELRTERHRLSADAYAAERGIALPAQLRAEVEDLALGDVEAALSSASFVQNIVVQRKLRQGASKQRGDRR